MLVSSTAQTLIDSIRAMTDQDTVGKVTDTQLLNWIDREQQFLRRGVGEISPLYDVVLDFSLAGSTTTYNAGALADFSKIRTLSLKTGTRYAPMRVAPTEFGSTSSTDGVVGDYRLLYISRAVTLAATSDVLSLPAGAREVIEQRVAAMVRVRFEEDPSFHMAEAKMLWEDLRAGIVNQYRSTPRGIVEIGWGYPEWGDYQLIGRTYRLRGGIIEVFPGYVG